MKPVNSLIGRQYLPLLQLIGRCAVILLCLGILGCAQGQSRPPDSENDVAAPRPGSGTLDGASGTGRGDPNDTSLRGDIKIDSEKVYAVQPDPKRQGKFLWKIWASEVSIANPARQITGDLSDVSAVLSHNGNAAASLHAPTAQGDYINRTVIASGGVFMKSLSPSGSTLTADRVVWFGADDKIIATGHVVYRNGDSGVVIQTSQLVANTALRTISSSVGGSATVSKGL